MKTVCSKFLVVLVMVGFMLAGCAWFKKGSDVICNPTPEQQHTAALMLAAIDSAQAVFGEFVPMAKIIKVSAVLKTIQAGGCFVVAELAEVFEVVDAADATVMKSRRMVPQKMAYAPLRKFVK